MSGVKTSEENRLIISFVTVHTSLQASLKRVQMRTNIILELTTHSINRFVRKSTPNIHDKLLLEVTTSSLYFKRGKTKHKVNTYKNVGIINNEQNKTGKVFFTQAE